MTTATVELFYGLLAMAAMAGMVIVAVLRISATWSAGARATYGALHDAIAPHAPGLALLVAALATAGSLYFSEIAGFEPCTLCWYQRIAMYPLVVVLGVGSLGRDGTAVLTGRVLALLGAIVAGYHVALEWIPALDGGACDPTNPCTLVWFRTFGFISLPTLALTAFLLILTLLAFRPTRDGLDDRPEVAT